MEISIWAGGRWNGTVVAQAIVDEEDFETLNEHRWFLSSEGYALRVTPRPNRQTISMARFILGLERGDKRTADHINREKLDNRRVNLRTLSNHEQAQNRVHTRTAKGLAVSSMFRGVRRVRSGRWGASCRGQWLGTFDTEMEAAEAAHNARMRLMPNAVD